MKKLILALIASLLLQADTHNFRVVHFYDTTLTDVQLVLDDDNHTFSIWYKGTRLNDEFMIVSCVEPEKFCIVRKQKQFYGEIYGR